MKVKKELTVSRGNHVYLYCLEAPHLVLLHVTHVNVGLLKCVWCYGSDCWPLSSRRFLAVVAWLMGLFVTLQHKQTKSDRRENLKS